MKQYFPFLLLLLTISCNTENKENPAQKNNKTNQKQTYPPIHSEIIIGERIDGPAKVRDKPNGEILFELFDNALVEATPIKDNWFQILVSVDIEYEEFGFDSITKGRLLISNGDTIGRILKTHYVSTGRSSDDAYALVFGYTHKDNIKPETIIEKALEKEISKNQRDFSNWTDFIKTFKLEEGAVDYNKFDTYFNYENTIDDPSPDFRVVLLFESKQLVGLIHSRELNIENVTTHKLNSNYYISFYSDFSNEGQMDFVNYMNEWIKGVD